MGLDEYSAKPAYHNVEYEKDYFTKTGYEGYMDYAINTERVRKIIEMTHPKSVLDCGCAYGFISKRLMDKGIHSVGMDISHWCEKQGIIPGHFVRHDMQITPWPFKDKEFDVAYCEGVLEHVEDDRVDDIMAEFERVSRRRILALTFDWHVELSPYSKFNSEAPGHINLHSHNWWFEKMPEHTWLFYPATGIQDSNVWLYKA